jgi:hypothetical protein
MAEFKSYRKGSLIDWGAVLNDNEKLTTEQITMGAMLRIADATELMAKNYTELQSNLEMYKRRYNQEREKNYALRRRIDALRGHMTRLKNKLNLLSDEKK